MTRRSYLLAVVLVLAACSGGGEEHGARSGGGRAGGSGGLGAAQGASGGAPGGRGGNAVGSGGTPAGMGGGKGGAAGGPGSGGTAGSGPGGAAADCKPLAPITRRVLALQPAQFANATRDLLGLAAAPELAGSDTPRLPAPDFFVTADHLYAFYVAAGEIVKQVPPRVSSLAACGAAETEVECATRFARSFGRIAFRRALD